MTNSILDIFLCPSCDRKNVLIDEHNNMTCSNCGFIINRINNIPVILKDVSKIEAYIDCALKGLSGNWYKKPQKDQFKGPYRHHLTKRRTYVENVISVYKAEYNRPISGLDLGCGDGANFSWLSKFFDYFYASDYNMIRLSRAVEIETSPYLFLADITKYPCVDNSFDIIYFNHVLEHIPDDVKALSEVFRILKPGGLLILGIPNEGEFFWQLAYKLQPGVLRKTDHVHFYTYSDIKSKCEKVGFLIKEIRLLGWGVPHWYLDFVVRRFKWVDDFLEFIGEKFFKKQATSMYVIASKTTFNS